MAKIFLDHINVDIEKNYSKKDLDNSVNEIPCLIKECNGRIRFNMSQAESGLAAICNECNRGIVMKLFKN